MLDSATNRRDTALLDVDRSVTSDGTGSNVLAYRRVDTPAATAASVCSSSGSVAAAHWKLASGTSPSALRTRSRGSSTCRPPSVTLAVDTAAAPHGPLDLMAPLRATQHFPVRLHHRLQNLQTGRDAQAMERLLGHR